MNPRYGAAMERSSESGGNLLGAIIESIETNSTRPILRAITGQRAEPAQPHAAAPTTKVQLLATAQEPAPQSQPHAPRQKHTEGHWVTINQRHIFIQESVRDRHDQHPHAPLHNQQRRKEIADIAKGV